MHIYIYIYIYISASERRDAARTSFVWAMLIGYGELLYGKRFPLKQKVVV